VLLEAGPNVIPEKDFKMLMWPYESPHAARAWAATPAKNFGEFLRRPKRGLGRLMAQLILRRRAQIFQWFRSRGIVRRPYQSLGPSIALTLCSDRFQIRHARWLGDDWPITYEDPAAVLRQSWNPTSGLRNERECLQRPTAFFSLLPNRAAPN